LTRSIPPGLSGILEDLELDQTPMVTSDHLSELVIRHGLKTPAKVVASRLRDRGWLLSTGRRGVWEFAPAAVAGPYSRNDPATPLRAFLASRPDAKVALTFQAAAWAHGAADRVPLHPEVAAATAELARQLPSALSGSVFAPSLAYARLRGVPVLAAESIVVHMSARPAAVRSWSSALEWLPDLTNGLDLSALRTELADRPSSVRVRTGYLLQGLRPDLAHQIHDQERPSTKTWFGPRGKLRRHDSFWQVADTILPFDPKELRAS